MLATFCCFYDIFFVKLHINPFTGKIGIIKKIFKTNFRFLINGGVFVSNIQLAANLQRLRKDHHFTQTQFSKKIEYFKTGVL